MSESKTAQEQWVGTAQTLRTVRRACLSYLDRWAVGRLMADAPALDRFADRVRAHAEAAIADPNNRDWSLFYRGSILDD